MNKLFVPNGFRLLEVNFSEAGSNAELLQDSVVYPHTDYFYRIPKDGTFINENTVLEVKEGDFIVTFYADDSNSTEQRACVITGDFAEKLKFQYEQMLKEEEVEHKKKKNTVEAITPNDEQI